MTEKRPKTKEEELSEYSLKLTDRRQEKKEEELTVHK
jgi:hypothetical protein